MRKATDRAKRRGSLFVFLGVRDSLQHWGHSGLEALFTHTLGFQDNSGEAARNAGEDRPQTAVSP